MYHVHLAKNGLSGISCAKWFCANCTSVVKWGASSWWSSLYNPMRNSDERTIGKTHTILEKWFWNSVWSQVWIRINLAGFFIYNSFVNPKVSKSTQKIHHERPSFRYFHSRKHYSVFWIRGAFMKRALGRPFGSPDILCGNVTKFLIAKNGCHHHYSVIEKNRTLGRQL